MAKDHGIAAKRSALRQPQEEDPEFQIAPMIDILLVLLVFFMSISSTEVLQSNDQVKLPIAKDAANNNKGKAKGQTIINVLWNPLNNSGGIDIDNKQFANPGDMVPYLQAKMQANPEMRVLVRADKSVRFEYMKQILRNLGASSVVNVTFSVVDKEGGGGGPKTASTQ